MSRTKPGTSSSPRTTRDERGSTTIELVILLPALFAVLFLGMQAALFYHARTVAIAAAQEGARAAGGENGRESDGARAANAFIADAGGDDALSNATVKVTRTETSATVMVVGHSLSVIPGWSPVVRQVASAPVERLTEP